MKASTHTHTNKHNHVAAARVQGGQTLSTTPMQADTVANGLTPKQTSGISRQPLGAHQTKATLSSKTFFFLWFINIKSLSITSLCCFISNIWSVTWRKTLNCLTSSSSSWLKKQFCNYYVFIFLNVDCRVLEWNFFFVMFYSIDLNRFV